jgi:hypothetical protein
MADRRGALAVALAAVAVAALGSTVAGARGTCGAGTPGTVAAVDAQVMASVHRVELDGSEERLDYARIAGAGDLLSAVRRGDRAATLLAVQRIVYHHYWHIVRLRVTDTRGRLLADFGGPEVISPVPGTLRVGGRPVGAFVMSVQDDAGFVKLARRFIGDPAGIYRDGRLVFGLPAGLPQRLPASGTISFGGERALVSSQTFGAFPGGVLRFSLLVGGRAAAFAGQPCEQVRVDEFASVASHLQRPFRPIARHYGPYAVTVGLYTGALVFVRDGATQLAASTGAGAGPASLPNGGAVTYAGATWDVVTLEPSPPAVVYLLVARPGISG